MNPRMTFFPYNDWTCLHWAALLDRFDIFQFISKNVANVNPKARNSSQDTPLHLAARYGHFDICKFIVDAIEDLSPKNGNNNTPYDYARENGYSDICIYIDKVRNERNGVNLISSDETMLKAEGGWPYKNMAKFFSTKNKDPVQSSSCVIS